MDLLKITRAEYIEGYSLKLWFNNGEVRVADLSGSFVGPVFEALRDVRCFMNFKIPYNTFQLASGFGHINGHICGCPRCLGHTGNQCQQMFEGNEFMFEGHENMFEGLSS